GIVGGVADPGGDLAGEAVPLAVEHPHRQHLGVPPQPGDADAVVGNGGDEPGHRRAVALGVGRVVTGEVLADDDLAGQVGLGDVDVGVDDGHQHVGVAVGDGPGAGGADVHKVGR